MEMRALILLVSVGLVACAHQNEWTRRDTVLQLAVTAAIVADAVTTARIQDHPNIHEDGPIARSVLGTQPKTADTYLYMGTLAVANYFITRALPAKWRPYWQGYEIYVHGRAAYNNCQIGLC